MRGTAIADHEDNNKEDPIYEEFVNNKFMSAVETLLFNWKEQISSDPAVVAGQVQPLLNHYKVINTGYCQISKEEIDQLISQYKLKFRHVINTNLKKLHLGKIPDIVSKPVEELYTSGLNLLTDFYDNLITDIEASFIKELVKIVRECDDDVTFSGCEDLNERLALKTKDQFFRIKDKFDDIKNKIYKSLLKFQLKVIPETVTVTIKDLFTKSLSKLTWDIEDWNRQLGRI